MNHQELIKTKALISATHAYYGKEISDLVLAMHADDISQLEFSLVSKAFIDYRRNKKNRFPPLPADIASMVDPESIVTDEDEAREAAARIITAVTERGQYDSSRAAEDIGVLGWIVVTEYLGGWAHFCQTLMAAQIPTVRAQVRDMALSVIHNAKAGTINERPGLPQKLGQKGISNISFPEIEKLN